MHCILSKKYTPKKYLGQNFLHDKNIIDKIINFINPKKKDTLIEIGPGLAALTKPICHFVDKLFVIELDKDIIILLKKFHFYKKLIVFNMNVMHFNFQKLFIQENNILRIFGNIPYNISVQLILYLIQFQKYILDINFMIQKEVADRLIAKPGNKLYGRLSIITQCYYDINIGFNIFSKSFFPIPKVNSSFIKMTPKLKVLYPLNKINFLKKITFLAFKKRRKMLKNSLMGICDENSLLNLNINPNIRAENVSIYEYCKLADFLYSLQ